MTRAQGVVMVVLRPLSAEALVVRSRYFIVEPRPFPAVPLAVRRRCLIVVPRPMPASQVLDRGAQANTRGAMHALDDSVQAVARGAARCALHVRYQDRCLRP